MRGFDPQPNEPWQKTPWWHPYRWFGYDIRKRYYFFWPISNEMEWVYRNSQEEARKTLKYLFDVPEVAMRSETEEL